MHDWIIHFYLDAAMDDEWRSEKALNFSDAGIREYMRSAMRREAFVEVAVAKRRDNEAIQIEVVR